MRRCRKLQSKRSLFDFRRRENSRAMLALEPMTESVDEAIVNARRISSCSDEKVSGIDEEGRDLVET